jgi:ATP-dependent exoDNAse (exonuclease V) alpha subunit
MRARAARVGAGEVEADGIALGTQIVGVGDEIVTTQNDRRLVTTTGAWVRNGDRWRVDQQNASGALHLHSLAGRGTVTLPGGYVAEHVALAYAVTVHRSQGLTCDQAVLVVDRSTSAEHLYVGMTRGRHHNLACVVTEPGGDEHTRRPAPTAEAALASALRRTSVEKSATETLRDELEHLQAQVRGDPRDAIIEGLRQAQQHSYEHAVRRQAQRQANPFPGHSPAPTLTRGGPEL